MVPWFAYIYLCIFRTTLRCMENVILGICGSLAMSYGGIYAIIYVPYDRFCAFLYFRKMTLFSCYLWSAEVDSVSYYGEKLNLCNIDKHEI